MHVIRLRSPWVASELPTAGSPGARYERRFNKPTGLSSTSQVRLAIDPATNIVAATLNGQSLSFEQGAAAVRIDIAPLLQSANRLTVDIATHAELNSDELPFSVQLEIVD